MYTSTKKRANGGFGTVEKTRFHRTPGSSTGDDDYPDVEIVEDQDSNRVLAVKKPANMLIRMQVDIEKRKIKQETKKRMQDMEANKMMS